MMTMYPPEIYERRLSLKNLEEPVETVDWRKMFCDQCPHRYKKMMGIVSCSIAGIDNIDPIVPQWGKQSVNVVCNMIEKKKDDGLFGGIGVL